MQLLKSSIPNMPPPKTDATIHLFGHKGARHYNWTNRTQGRLGSGNWASPKICEHSWATRGLLCGNIECWRRSRCGFDKTDGFYLGMYECPYCLYFFSPSNLLSLYYQRTNSEVSGTSEYSRPTLTLKIFEPCNLVTNPSASSVLVWPEPWRMCPTGVKLWKRQSRWWLNLRRVLSTNVRSNRV